MPRYYFHLDDGQDIRDEQGLQLPDQATAQVEAARLAGACLFDKPRSIWKEKGWTLDVTDETGLILFTLHIFVDDSTPVRTDFATS